MKTVVTLLLLCLFDPGQSDCQADCLSCNNILPKRLSFNTMVCFIECESSISPSSSWDLCREALLSPILSPSGSVWKRSQEEVETLFPGEDEQMMKGRLFLPIALQRVDHVIHGLDAEERDLGGKGNPLNTAYNSQNVMSLEDEYAEDEEGQEGGDPDGAARGQGDAALISKRFGGFVKGRHGYRRLMSPGRSYQKRYGGFIGIRKSARKWNNQKRFSEFLKQYLGMSTRATEFNSVSEDLTQQNEV